MGNPFFSIFSKISKKRSLIILHGLLFFTVSILAFIVQIYYGESQKQFSVNFLQQSSRELLTPESFRRLGLQRQTEALRNIGEKRTFQKAVSFLKEVYPDEPPNRHDLAHILGEIAFQQHSFDGFGLCDTFLEFGCYHGAALAAVQVYGLDPNIGENLWNGCKNSAPEPKNCLHGLGHAMMIIRQYNLLAAFVDCERVVRDEKDSYWCQDGAAMEGTMRTAATNGKTEPYGRKDDLAYPCNTIPLKYETVCVANHIGFIERTFQLPIKKLVTICSSFQLEKTKNECIKMLGSIQGGKFYKNPDSIVSYCNNAESYTQYCIQGAARRLAGVKQFDGARKLCDVLSMQEKNNCLAYINDLFSSRKD